MSGKKIIVVGAGVAGLSAAVRLRIQGHEVSVYERNSHPGGKLAELQLGPYRFDLGPSLFTMPQYIDDLVKSARKNPEDYLTYHRKKTVCNYFWEDGTRFGASGDTDEFISQAAQTFVESERSLNRYMSNSKLKFDATASLFLEKSLHRLKTYLSFDTVRGIISIPKLNLFSSLHQTNQTYFKNEKLVQLFDRYATYNGSSPYKTPGIMTMIPHLEQFFGTYYPEGGMHQIAQALYKLAVDTGVEVHFDTDIERIRVENKKVRGIETSTESIDADVVVSNMDVVPTYRYLLKDQPAPEKTLAQERSSSAMIFYWGINGSFPELDLHNIVFSDDYKEEFDAIFNRKELQADPTIYINITSKEDASDAPENHENWFVMINVPGNTGQDWDSIIPKAKELIIRKLSRVLKRDIEPLIQESHVLDPRGIEANTRSFQGSLYGAASNDRNAAFLRHPNFSKAIKGLYFCGGSVHPGGGIPLCMMSGKITSEIIADDYR